MITLKIKKPQSNSCLFESRIKPYTDKILEEFKKTQLLPELIEPIELAIRNKTTEEVLKMHKETDFNTYKLIYMNNTRHIIENVKNNNGICNIQLIEKLNTKCISPTELVNMSPQEMFQERWQTFTDKVIHDINCITKDPVATTTLYTCGRCHRNKCTYYSSQDRSADESMTTHITCCYCGKKWKQ